MTSHKKHSVSSLILIFTAAVFLIPAYAAAEDKSGETLVVSYSATSIQLDPAHSFTTTEAQLYTAIYEGLVSYNPLTLTPVPAAASRWVISPDGKTYTFFLRDNGRYWNGDPVISNHFRDAWLRLLEPEEDAEYSFMFDIIQGAKDFRMGENSDPESVGIKVISPLILEIKLNEKADYFLKLLCHHSFSPVNPKNLDGKNWKEGPSTVGNGPFYITKRSDEFIELTRNLLYWDRKNVSLPEINVLFSSDPEESVKMFNEEEIHWASSGVYLRELTNPDFIVTNPLFGTTYYYFRVEDSLPLADPDVRRALSLIIPWDQIRNTGNYFIPSSTLVPPIPGYLEVRGIEGRDMKEALSLLHKAGYTKGRGIGRLNILVPESRENLLIATFMKQQWEKFLDIEVEITAAGFDSYYDLLKTSEYSIGMTTWIGDYADPLTFLQMWTADSNLNDSGYNNPEYDRLLQQAVKEAPEQRYKIMAEAEEILLQTSVVMPLENYPAFNAVNTNLLDGWYPNVLDIHPFKYIKLRTPGIPEGLVRWDSTGSD